MIALVLPIAFAQASAATPPADACALLTNADLERTVRAPIVERKPVTETAGGLLMAQCFFGTQSSRSVSLAVAGATTGPAAVTPRQYWKRQFHPPERRAEQEKEPDSEARAVGGIGDEAFWMGNRIAGALYVLSGNTFLRISVGGIPDEAARIEQSKTLARAALRRLKG